MKKNLFRKKKTKKEMFINFFETVFPFLFFILCTTLLYVYISDDKSERLNVKIVVPNLYNTKNNKCVLYVQNGFFNIKKDSLADTVIAYTEEGKVNGVLVIPKGETYYFFTRDETPIKYFN